MEWVGWLVVLYAFAAMVMDLAKRRISNWYLLFGWAAGAVVQFFGSSSNWWVNYLGGVLLPIFLLFILFYFRMMGAGDLKMLSVLGGMTGFSTALPLILCSFVFGSIISIGILTFRKSWSRRFRFFYRYCRNYIMTGIRVPYRPQQGGLEEVHFAVPVFLAVLAWKGGLF